MPIIPIDSESDPRIDAYRDMKDRELAAMGGLFIAEGEHVTRRLLASDYATESLLLARRRVEELAPSVPEHVPIYVAPDEVITQIMGFKFHSGVIASEEWGPNGPLAVAIRRDMSCAPCYISKVEECHRKLACLTRLTPGDVLEACAPLLLGRVAPNRPQS